MADLPRLASLLKSRNTIDEKMAALIGHTAQLGNIGEYIVAAIFDIALDDTGKRRGYDGRFTRGPLAGKTVDIHWHPKHDGQMSIKMDAFPAYYLVLTGPASSANFASPWLIESIYLFDANSLFLGLRERGVQIGSSTSVTGPLWERAEIYPVPRNTGLVLTEDQRKQLILFS